MKIYPASAAPGTEPDVNGKLIECPQRLISYHHIVTGQVGAHEWFYTYIGLSKDSRPKKKPRHPNGRIKNKGD